MDTLSELARTLAAVRATTKRLEKRRILVEYLQSLSDGALPLAVTYLCGRPLPRRDQRTLSVGGSAFSQALLEASPSLTGDDLRAAWLRHSDAGDTAADLWATMTPMDSGLTLQQVAAVFESLTSARGPTQKVPILADAFRHMDSDEIRAFVKVMLYETRIGVQEGTVEDAVAHAFGFSIEEVRAANRHVADLGAVALDARRGELVDKGFAYFTPVDPMLSHPAENPEEVMRRLPAPIWVEDKFDGIRCQLHKVGDEVRLYSRDRKDITRQFPEVVAAFQAGSDSYALDGELMALEDGRSLPFARMQQRLGRVDPSERDLASHYIALVAFDCLACGEESLLDRPLIERREVLESLSLPAGQLINPRFTAESAEEIEELFHAAQARGNEGLMCKDFNSPYASGRRGYQWLKVKKPLETLDCVVVGAEWGHGKRRDVLSDYTFAVIDDRPERPGTSSGTIPETQQPLVTVGKAYGGLTDVEILEMTERLKEITTRDFGRYRSVEPEIVLEVEFNGIQRSGRHKSGFALRFPRMVRIRRDKRAEDSSTLSDVERIYRAVTGES